MIFSRLYSITSKSFLVATTLSLFIQPKTNAQSARLWNEAASSLVLNDATRYSTPISFRTTELDIAAMRQLLSSAPKENLENAIRSDVIISIPMPDGSLSDFRIWETAVMAPGLQEHFPNIRTYVAEGVTDHRAVARFDVTDFGFHAMILSPRGDVFIDPVSNGDDRHYISYYKRDLAQHHEFACGVTDETSNEFQLHRPNHSETANRSSGTDLRTYRLALACTGEYAVTKGGTKSGALSGMVTSLNRVDGIYEEELSIRMQLVPNDTLLIFLNGSTDGYSNNDGGVMLGQNQTKCNNVIGSANYDIGHVFSTGGGGIADLGCVCRNSSKAQGVTGSPNPVGDAFDVDYVAHEMGHQFGANHSFNSTTGSCGGGTRWGASAFEPGSGSTIMSYAGICSSNDLQPHSDAFFHAGSFDEIVDYTTLDIGNNCPVITSTGNTPPKPSAGKNYSIPISTPFRLDGSASDVNGDSLAYMWDEMDHGPACDWNNPSGQAPLFRSWDEDTFGYRYFPKLITVINNYSTSIIGETLADYARTINFRFIARDHHVGGGGVTYNDTLYKLTVVNTSTPFQVTFPNTGITWAINTPWAVTWDVSSTNVSPINCSTVNVLLSIDGGFTYPIVLASNVPNNGVAPVTMPNDQTLVGNTHARVMVQSVGNVFYDISNHNFTITDNVGINDIADISAQVTIYPNPVNNELNVEVSGLNNESLTMQLRDVVGRVLNEVHFNHTLGEKKISFDMKGKAIGVYIMEVQTDHGSTAEKVVKQ